MCVVCALLASVDASVGVELCMDGHSVCLRSIGREGGEAHPLSPSYIGPISVHGAYA